MPIDETNYFFSYARDDSDSALKLAKELRAVGANLWLDQLDIVGGQRWDRAVEEALATCQSMIVVLSPESVVSNTAPLERFRKKQARPGRWGKPQRFLIV